MQGKVIIVDDDRDTREGLTAILEARGFDVASAQSGLRLISILRVDRPDVILLDVMMSWIDGFELCRALKRNPEYREIPICFISGRSDEADIQQGMRCGAAHYFVKPIDSEQLIAKVDEIVRRSQTRHGAPPRNDAEHPVGS